MFGKKGLFGKGGMALPGYGGGMFDMSGMPSSLPDMASVPTTASGMFGDPTPQDLPTRSPFFGKGGPGRAIAGTVGDVLLQHNGLAPMYGPQMQMQQAMEFRQAEAQRERAAELADYEAKLRIDQRYAGSTKMDEFDTAMVRAGIQQGTPEYARLAREYALRKAQGDDETVVVPIPGRGTFVGPRSALQTAIGGAPAPTPVPQSDWDNANPLGGTGGNVGGSFR